MKSNFFSVFFLLNICTLVSQNYSIINPSRDYFYIRNEQTFAVRVDSVSVIEDETNYYHFTMFRDTSEYSWQGVCLDIFGGSLLGKMNILKPNGDFKLLNFLGDTISILPFSEINESWKLYEWSNGNYIQATVTDISTHSVLGQNELVKTITFTVKDVNNSILEHPFNQKKIKISENHGLVQTFDFYMFPKDTSIFLLEGITYPQEGYIMNQRTVFDYEVGDEFHYMERSEQIAGWPTQFYNGYIQISMKKIIEKSFSIPDTAVTYKYLLCSRIINYSNTVPDTTYSLDTLSETIIFHNPQDSTFHLLPGQTFESEIYQMCCFPNPIIEQYNSLFNNRKTRVYFDRTDVMNDDSCWHWVAADPAPGVYKYVDGLGGPYYFVDSWEISIPIRERKLLYYRKGNETWGTSVAPSCESLINSIPKSVKNNIYVFPNPTSDFIQINNLDNQAISSIQIFNTMNQLVLKSQNFGNAIQVSNLPEGFYFLHIQTSIGEHQVVKFLKINPN